jgi:hypothetical protein
MRNLLSLALLLPAFSLFAQAPQQIKYQGVARDAAGAVIANGTLTTVQFEIHDVAPAGTVIYTEVHTGVSTNQFGLFSVNIGSITPIGPTVFVGGNEYLEVSVDFGTGLTSMGTSQMLSVPYALYADSCGTSATAGQGITEVYGSGQVSVGASTTSAVLIPGLTTTVNIPSNSVVHVHTDGGIQSTGATSATYSVVDVILYVDGVATTTGGQRRIAIANTSALAQLIGNWSIDHTYTLPAGNHTFEVKAVGGVAGSSAANVSSGSAPQLRGVLSVQVLKQ